MPGRRGDSRVAGPLVWMSLLCLATAILLEVLGGFTLRLAVLRLSIHQPWVLLATGLIGLGIAWQPGWRAATRQALGRGWIAVEGVAGWCAVGLASAVLVAGLTFGTFVAGGSDSYGYVSQARLWSRGQPVVSQPLALLAPWPEADWTFAPLGYRPGPVHGTIVPTYPPGLPLMMAAAIVACGSPAEFWIVPLLGALGVLLVFGLGRALFGPLPALMAAVWLATCPIFLQQLVQPMSDVPAMTCCLAATYLAVRADRWAGLLSGLAVSCAVLVRPNLALLAVPVGVLLWLSSADQKRPRTSRLLSFALGLLPGVLLLGWTQSTLYGSWFVTGYGDTRALFRFRPARLLKNLGHYSHWLWLSNAALAFASPLALMRKSRRTCGAALLFLALAGALPYAFYRPFDDWSYLRFLLPVLPVLLVLACGAYAILCDRLPTHLRVVPTLMLGVLLLSAGLRQAGMLEVFSLKERERHYAEVGHYVARALPARAVLLSCQQSGSLRLYSNRLTLRWDLLDPAWLDRAVAWLEERGHEAYLVLETGEEQLRFERRFAGRSPLARLDWSPVAVRSRQRRVGIYRLTDRERPGPSAPDLIP